MTPGVHSAMIWCSKQWQRDWTRHARWSEKKIPAHSIVCLFWRRGWWVGFGKLSYKQVRTPRSINPAANCFDQFVVSIQFKSLPQARVCMCAILFIKCKLVLGPWQAVTAGYSCRACTYRHMYVCMHACMHVLFGGCAVGNQASLIFQVACHIQEIRTSAWNTATPL